MKDAITARTTLYCGTHGNLSSATLKDVLSATPANTEINMGVIPAGTEVIGLKVVHDNLGSGTSVELGYSYVDPDDGLESLDYFGSFTTTQANAQESTAKPMRFESPAHLIAKVKGGAATGEVCVLPTYISLGVK